MFDVRHNIAEVERGLSDLARRELPFALSLAINETLGDVKKNTERKLPRQVDRPTPFTLRGLGLRRSTKRRLAGAVLFKDVQAAYLRWLARPGTRRPEGGAIVMPVAQKLNRYGNIPRRALARAVARPDTFATGRGDPARSHLPGGIYRRLRSGRLRMLAAFEPAATYDERRLRFQEDARKTAEARLPVLLGRHLARVLGQS
jgi:hypothetical protein